MLSPPIPVFKFDFTSKEPLSKKRECANKFKTEVGGKANAVFMKLLKRGSQKILTI